MFKVSIRSMGWMASQTPKPTMWPSVNFTGRSARTDPKWITLSDPDWSAASAKVSDMVGDLVARVGARRHAEPGDLYAAMRIARWRRPTPGSSR